MSRCEEICDAAPSCAPCSAYDAELDRVNATRRQYREGANKDGRPWYEHAGRMLHGTTRDD